ncbi:MAG TPA: serine/threonine-protein kinase [Polyangiaceae bacterium]|nr:serine/threonine-protein kinase [Polyangiaceae bacterium]
MERTSQQSPGGLWDGLVIDQRYRIVRPLGEGSMGSVYVAEHLALHKEVALKLVRSEFGGNRELLMRFAREALAGSRIDHPSVVQVLDYGPLPDGTAYLVMPIVAGTSLKDTLQMRGRLPWREVAELGAQVADALAAAWAQGFIHRDLKPDNVLLEPREPGPPLARLIDFGVAKLLDPSAPEGTESPVSTPLTKEGTMIGTPGYMAPEQALGRAATHAADLYSLGVLLWEALVGQRRWSGATIQAILQAQLREKRPSARDASGDGSIPHALDQLIERLVSPRVESRPDDARLIRDELRALLDGKASADAPAKPARAGRRSRTWLLVLGLLAAGALGSWFALLSDG